MIVFPCDFYFHDPVMVGGRVGTTVTRTAGTTNAVLTGIEDGWATTVVVHWQRQVGTT